MAKKRVHEIAKERGISSKEVIAVLQKAGLDVKASASSVDENDIAMAFSNGKKQDAAPAARGDRGGPQSSQRPGAPRPAGQAGDGQPAGGGQASAAGGGGAPSGGGQPASSGGGDRPQRPTRGGPPSGGPGGAGRRRRVVIDSQASRRPS